MSIKVQFFASLRELLGKQACEIEYIDDMNVATAWQQAAGDETMPANTLCAINMEYARPDDRIQDNDEVAFFPPVTGG